MKILFSETQVDDSFLSPARRKSIFHKIEHLPTEFYICVYMDLRTSGQPLEQNGNLLRQDQAGSNQAWAPHVLPVSQQLPSSSVFPKLQLVPASPEGESRKHSLVAQLLEFLIQQVCGMARDSAFLTPSWVMVMTETTLRATALA